jgi:hypothetical protein
MLSSLRRGHWRDIEEEHLFMWTGVRQATGLQAGFMLGKQLSDREGTAGKAQNMYYRKFADTCSNRFEETKIKYRKLIKP